ncbi:MAG: DUF3795 domain-containing protein [Candidatus Jordarchaeum sp.]|uniref:DUF3795 domain-containing protein n=1 Tax=Candidatus Jordarchaeum sp. TaxID=2823881 RepID=UPI0040496B9B
MCGLYCGNCEYYKEKCVGCEYLEGKPFWIEFMKVEVCPLYDCCVNREKLEHCGLCDKFPCKTFLEMELNDSSMSPEQAKQSAITRKNALIGRKKIGLTKWLKEKAE